LWPARLAIFAGFLLLLAQGASELVKRIAVLRGELDEPYPQHGAHARSDEAAQ
jgi:TRAP-type mannitol/chloroaromatic compound transport system permease small subunit